MKRLKINKEINKIFASALLFFIFASFPLYLWQRVVVFNIYEEFTSSYIQNMRSYISQRLGEYSEEIRFIASNLNGNDAVHKIVNNHDEFNIYNFYYQFSESENVIISDMEGKYFLVPGYLKSTKKHDDYNPTSRPWFVKSSSFHAKPFFSLPYKDFFSSQNWVSLSLPLFDKKYKQSGVVAISLSINKLRDFMQRMQGVMDGELVIVTNDGKVVATGKTNDKKSLPHFEGEYGTVEDDNFKYYFQSLRNPDWYVVLKVNKKTIDDIIYKETKTYLYAIVVGLLVLFFCWRNMLLNVKKVERELARKIINNEIGSKGKNISEIFHSITVKQSELDKQVNYDGLTGLYNRKTFERDILKINNTGKDYLALIDIDNFKLINDTWGHTTGDEVLRGVAAIVIELTKKKDATAYRFGGEEIAIIYRNISQNEALSNLNILRKSVEVQTWSIENLKVTFSAGLSAFSGHTIQGAVDAADKRLYEAKVTGKNKVVC